MFDIFDFYPKKVEGLNILEAIDEKFDGVSRFLTNNSFIYGSAVNSIIAGLPILGDLDIAISAHEYMIVAKGLANSVKWIQIQGETVREDDPTTNGNGLESSSMKKFLGSTEGKLSWRDGSHRKSYTGIPNIKTVLSFKNMTGSCIQIMASKVDKPTYKEQALELISNVDLVCCALAVDFEGNVFETIKGALSDCNNRILRLNPASKFFDEERTLYRVHKYLKRGWALGESLDTMKAKIREISPKKEPKTQNLSGPWVTSSERNGFVILVKGDVLDEVGLDALQNMAYINISSMVPSEKLRGLSFDILPGEGIIGGAPDGMCALVISQADRVMPTSKFVGSFVPRLNEAVGRHLNEKQKELKVSSALPPGYGTAVVDRSTDWATYTITTSTS